MINIVRTTSDNVDFNGLIELLDAELNDRYGVVQKEYDRYNKIEFIDTVVAYLDNIPAGCGCFKIFDNENIEIKRMFVKSDVRRNEIALNILLELENWIVEKGFSSAVLETGILQPEAISFYNKSGFYSIDNYGQYIGNKNSVCMRKEIKNKTNY